MREMAVRSCLMVICVVSFLATLQTTAAEERNPLRKLAKAILAFSADLYQKITESSVGQNVFFSPTSIYVALAMLYAGSGGETKAQLASALHLDLFDFDDSEFYESIKVFLQALESTKKNYTLKMANQLFGQEGFDFKGEYRQIVDEYFNTKLEELDFSEDPSGSGSKINKWVSRMTSDKIKELFPNDTITSHTLLALANAVYFRGTWLYKFDKRDTKPHAFYLSNGKKIKVPMMNLPLVKSLGYNASETSEYRVLELPYSSSKVSILIYLFNKANADSSLLEKQVRDNSTRELFRLSRNVSVKLSLPKFTLQPTVNLKDSLQALGIKNLFSDRSADLSGIDKSGLLEVSHAMHKAYISFNEEGQQAAGATGGNVKHQPRPFREQQPVDFVVDWPFAFIVLEKASECILFFGRVINPLRPN